MFRLGWKLLDLVRTELLVTTSPEGIFDDLASKGVWGVKFMAGIPHWPLSPIP